MRLYPEKLAEHLRRQLLPVYLIGGDEPLILLECADLVRQAARAAGATERDVMHADAGFDWSRLAESGASLSLFGDRRIIELRLGRVPDAAGQQAITAWCERPAEDTTLLVTFPALDWKTLKSAWVVAIEQAGALLEVKPVTREALPAWIRQRLARAGISATADAIEMLADRVEGNLLAAQQEIDLLALLAEGRTIDAAQLAALVSDSSRFDADTAIDAALRGDAARALRALSVLREEGENPVPVLWAVQRDVRYLLVATEGAAQGDGAAARPPGGRARQAGFERAALRLKIPALRMLLADCAKSERINKGQAPGDPWDALASLLARLAGARAPGGKEIA